MFNGLSLSSPYNSRAFAPVTEERTSWHLTVRGSIPPELTGQYIRNGSNPPPVDIEGPWHWFLGDGMVHGVELRDGRAVTYRSRWVRTEALARKMPLHAAGGPADVDPAGNVANTAVVQHAGRLLALCETGLPYELTRELETVGRYDFAGRLRAPMSAHPKIDPESGEMFFMVGSLEPPHARLHHISATGEYLSERPVAMRGVTLVHDMALTKHYAIAFDQPVILDPSSDGFPFGWNDSYQARVGLLPRPGSGRKEQWFDIEPCFFIHAVNAYEDGDTVVLDVSRFGPGYMASGNPDPFNQSASNTVHRFVFDLKAGTTREQTLSDRPTELPAVHPRFSGRPYTVAYGVLLNPDAAIRGYRGFGSLARLDVRKGSVVVQDLGEGSSANEPTFVPAAGGDGESDGWVLSYVYDAARDASNLVVVDATNFGGKPQAIIELPARVPAGFHGTWVPAS